MRSVKSSTTHHRVLACPSLLEHHQVAGRNVSVTANVQIKWHVLIANAEIHALGLVIPWPVATLLITCRFARVLPVIQAIHLFSAQSCPVSL